MNKVLFSFLLGFKGLFLTDDVATLPVNENNLVVENVEVKENDNNNNNFNVSEILEGAKEVIDKVEDGTTEEEIKISITDYLSKYLERDMVEKVVSWLFDIGIGGALLVIYKRYRKYKDKSISEMVDEFNTKSKDYIQKAFKDISKDKLDEMTKTIDNLSKTNETIMKVLVLMQDNTSKGKIALMDYLGSKTNSEEVKEAVNEVSNVLEEKEKIEQEIKDKVSNDYENIF